MWIVHEDTEEIEDLGLRHQVMKSTFTLKNDAYRRKRGGRAAFFILSCAKCNTKLMLYQKDDPRGILKRLYADRIVAPPRLAQLVSRSMKAMPLIKCQECQHVIGVPYVYPKEKRKTFLVEIGSVKKKLSGGIY